MSVTGAVSDALALWGGAFPLQQQMTYSPGGANTLTLPTRYPVEDTPPNVKHGGMVIYVEEGDLAAFLSQYEEDGVHEFNYFGKIIPPQHLGYLYRREQRRWGISICPSNGLIIAVVDQSLGMQLPKRRHSLVEGGAEALAAILFLLTEAVQNKSIISYVIV